MLHGLLTGMDTDPELILAHLNSLLTEINTAYFSDHKRPADDKLSKFIGFKLFVEDNLTSHPAIIDIAENLSLTPTACTVLLNTTPDFLRKNLSPTA
ncbi:MAG: hypothetical protein WDN75_19650 [Bacteroidota bacterium]